jgi:VanZ family protein
LRNWTPWTVPVEPFSRSGAKNLKNMSPKIRPVKIFLEKDVPRPGFRAEVGDQRSGVRALVSGIRKVIKHQATGPESIRPGGKTANNKLSKLQKFFIYWFPILVYCLLIFIQSSRPLPEIKSNLPYFDKVLHFAAYALLGALFLRAFNTTQIKHNLKLIIMLSILLSSLYGISDEIHQSFVPFRTADTMDALADILGSVFGVSIFSLWFNSYLKRHV